MISAASPRSELGLLQANYFCEAKIVQVLLRGFIFIQFNVIK